MKKRNGISPRLKIVIQGLPLVAAAGASFLPLQHLGQQLTMLIVLLWIQVFFVIECFMSKK